MNGPMGHLSGSETKKKMNLVVIFNLITLFTDIAPRSFLSFSSRNNPLFASFSRTSLLFLSRLMRDSHFFQLRQLTDMWVSDFPDDTSRFQVNYYFLSLRYNFRILFRSAVSVNTPIRSISLIFPSASWLEREAWDMYGVFFEGHNDLRRILTDYGFEGHPLRKDFPLSGYTQLRFDDELKQIVSESVSFSQEYRYFDFLNPWTGDGRLE